MTTARPVPCRALRMAGRATTLGLVLAVAGCADLLTPSASPRPSPSPSPEASGSPTPTPHPTPSPTPTPAPTPRFTNEADGELRDLIPEAVGEVAIVRVPVDAFGLTPGDVGTAYGEIGVRFSALAIAYATQPRTTLYAMRVAGEPVATADLEPHLATAGRYVGIAGLDAGPWAETTVGGHRVWVRPEDHATAAGTMIYTWSSGAFVFLLIGVDDSLNRALVAALPGEPAPSPTETPTASPGAEG